MSDLAVFSFYPTKVLGRFGDGGMIETSDENLHKKLRRLRFYGMDNTYYPEDPVNNSRLDEIHAAILLRKLSHLYKYISRRREITYEYDISLALTSLFLPRTIPGNKHVYYLYVCRHPEREKIISELRTNEISVNVNYPWTIHTIKGYAYLDYREGDLRHTEKDAREIFNLPMYPTLSNKEHQSVISALHDILGYI